MSNDLTEDLTEDKNPQRRDPQPLFRLSALYGFIGAVVPIVGGVVYIQSAISEAKSNANEAQRKVVQLEIKQRKIIADVETIVETIKLGIPLDGIDSNIERLVVSGDLVVDNNIWGTPNFEVATGTGNRQGNSALCPEGTFVSGVEGLDNDSGDYCIDCLTSIKIICSPL